MTALRALLTHLPALIAGVALVDLLWPARRPADWLIKVFLGFGVGVGVASCLEFFWMLLFRSPINTPIWLDSALAGLLVAASALRWRKSRLLVVRQSAIHLPTGPGFVLAGLLLVMAGLGLYTGWLSIAAHPGGSFEAFSAWNLRARALFSSAPQTWPLAFSPLLSWKAHTDYPLLWSMTLLRSWKTLGMMYFQSGQVQAIAFGLASLGLMFSGLLRLRGLAQAALGSILLLAMPWFISFNTHQQADGALAFYYLAALFLLLRYEQGGNAAILALAGLVAGLAAWTKNDGLVFVLGAMLTLLLRYLRRPWGRSLGRLAPFALGLALPLVTILVFKVRLAPPGDLLGGQSLGQTLGSALDPGRWGMILPALATALPGLGGWSWPLVALVPVYGLLAGGAPNTRARGAWLWLVLGFTLLGYLGVFLVTPHDPAWQLQTSLNHLLFHLLPAGLFLMLALIKNPGQIFGLP